MAQLLAFELVSFAWNDGSVIGVLQTIGLCVVWAGEGMHDVAKAIYIVSLLRLLASTHSKFKLTAI